MKAALRAASVALSLLLLCFLLLGSAVPAAALPVRDRDANEIRGVDRIPLGKTICLSPSVNALTRRESPDRLFARGFSVPLPSASDACCGAFLRAFLRAHEDVRTVPVLGLSSHPHQAPPLFV